MSESEIIDVLRNSLYPGAKVESVKLVINYCKTAGLDPLKNPVHIVPMSVSTGKKNEKGWDIKEMRDVIMPGIGLYRIDAARSGQYAGITDPEFGPEITEIIGGTKITYPQWCRVTVKRLMTHGVIVEFSAKEFWRENYASAGRDKPEPNTTWKKRPFAQLAKCCEAQALRKAFPEVGAQATADEMEGQEIEINPGHAASTNNGQPPIDHTPSPIEFYSEASFTKNFADWKSRIESGTRTADQIINMVQKKSPLTEEQISKIRACVVAPAVLLATKEQVDSIATKAEAAGITWGEVCIHLGIDPDVVMAADLVDAAFEFIANPAGA